MAESLSDALARQLFANSPDGIVVVSDGIIRHANPAAVRKLGVNRAEHLIGRRFFEFIHPEEHALASARMAEVLDTGGSPPPRVVRFVRADGTEIAIETRGAAVTIDGQRYAQVVLRDAAERRRAELALRLSEERFRGLLEGMAEGVVLQDPDLTIRVWNPAAERILGLTGEQLGGVTSYDPRWRATDADGRTLGGDEHIAGVALRTNAVATGTMGVERANGERVWLHVNAVPLHAPDDRVHPYAVVTTFTDITSIRESTRRLEESEARYRLLATNSSDLVSLRTLDNRFTYVSASHEALLGWSEEELLGRDASEFRHPDDGASGGAAMKVLLSGGDPAPFSIRIRHKQGHYLWLEVVARLVHDEAGTPSGLQIAARDVTERRQVEEQLRQSQKLEAMGRMAGGVAHDFNNALTVVRASAGMLLLSGVSETERRQLVNDIETAADRAAGLSAQLLTFSSRYHVSPREVNVARLLRETMPLFTQLAGSRVAIELSVDADAETATVAADPVLVQQALFNLIINASDTMPAGGIIRVRCAAQQLPMPLPYRHGVLAAGSYVTIGISDEGAGMTEEVQEHLFEPFYTTKPQGKGVGLGLATAFGIVQKANGAITVTSTPGHGAQFVVHLPIVEAPTQATPSTPIPSPTPSPERPRFTNAPTVSTERDASPLILVVDDEPAVCQIAAVVLRRAGFAVLAARSGADALAHIRRERSGLQAVVTDVRMPGMTGVEMVTQMLHEGISLPILFMSGQLDAAFPAEWPADAPHHFLGKPFAGSALVEAVRHLLAAVKE